MPLAIPDHGGSTGKRLQRRAQKAGLVYVNEFDNGITRRRCGKGFSYVLPSGQTLRSKSIRNRIEELVIPPSWKNVWVCSNKNGHIQAMGTDDAGRRQYIYHPDWQTISNAAKFDRLEQFAQLLPRIRRRVRKDVGGTGLSRHRVVAAVVRLLDKANLRVGNARYATRNGSRGATTLADEHVDLDGFKISLDFPSKSRKRRCVEFRDRKAAKVIQQCQELDGQFLFTYEADDGDLAEVRSSDVNRYLESISGAKITAKDFRTWSGSVLACAKLASLDPDSTQRERKKALVVAIKATAGELGNTPAVCRNSYVHPGIIASAQSGDLPKLIESATAATPDSIAEMTQDETLFVSLLPRLSPHA